MGRDIHSPECAGRHAERGENIVSIEPPGSHPFLARYLRHPGLDLARHVVGPDVLVLALDVRSRGTPFLSSSLAVEDLV